MTSNFQKGGKGVNGMILKWLSSSTLAKISNIPFPNTSLATEQVLDNQEVATTIQVEPSTSLQLEHRKLLQIPKKAKTPKKKYTFGTYC